MHKDWNYFLKEAENIVNIEGVSFKKNTSGIWKGEYSARLKSSDKIDWQQISEHYRKKYGAYIKYYSQHSASNIDKAKQNLIGDIALSLLEHNRRSVRQLYSELWNFYNETKEEFSKDIYYEGRIGRENIDYFDILNKVITKDNWAKTQLKQTRAVAAVGVVTNFKEFYYFIKNKAKEDFLSQNKKYRIKDDWQTPDLNTFVWDEENIPEISEIERGLDEKTPIIEQKTEKQLSVSEIKNEGYIKIGFRKEFLNTPILYGRKRNIFLANGEKHQAQYAIVELSNILASHNEYSFIDTENYPVNSRGENINDRNYANDKTAQAKVKDIEQNFEPEIQISTSVGAAGLPIITVDGIVVSGNNRIMSFKRMVNDFPDNYTNYLQELSGEIESFGFKYTVGSALIMKDRISLEGSSFNNPLSVKFQQPVLVRIDYDFQEYTTTEMNKYNKDTKKSERPIDRAIKLSSMLLDNEVCVSKISNVISKFDVLSDLYNSPADVKLIKSILTSETCNILTIQELPTYFTENNLFTQNGKEFIVNMLSAVILDKNAILSSEIEGVKSFKEKIIVALPELIKNKKFAPEESLQTQINEAIILQQKLVSSKLSAVEYSNTLSLFGEKQLTFSYKAYLLNLLLSGTKYEFKKFIKLYNNSIEENKGASMFGEVMSPDFIFEEHIKKFVDEKEIGIIKRNLSNVVSSVLETGDKQKAQAQALAKIKILKLKLAKK